MSERRAIPGHGGAYAVTSDGRVFTTRPHSGRHRPLSITDHPPRELRGTLLNGYRRVELNSEAGRKCIFVHRLVAEAFIGPYPDGLVINHKDGNQLNNHASNLEYVTQAENVRHSWRTGLVKGGEARGAAKLTEAQVLMIRSRYESGKPTRVRGHKHPDSTRSLGAEFGVSGRVVHLIVQGKIWKHVRGPVFAGEQTADWPVQCPER
jgi:hypothetical protein